MKDEKLTQIMFRSLNKDPNLASYTEWKNAGDFAKDMRFFPHALSCYQRARELKLDDEILQKINDLIDKITNVLEYVPEKIKPKIEEIRLSNPLDPGKWLAISNSLLKELSDSLAAGKSSESDLDAAKFALGFTAYCLLRSGNDASTINSVLEDILEPVNLSSWSAKKIDIKSLAVKKADQPIRMIALGDNVSLGLQPDWEIKFNETYPYLWAKDSGYGISLANNSISGAGVMDLTLYLGRDVINYKPDLITVMFGNNDAWFGKEILPAYEALLEVNLKYLMKSGIEVVLLSPIPHIPSACPENERPLATELSEVEIDSFVEATKRVAYRLDCAFIDSGKYFPEDETARAQFFINGFNQPNLEGQELIKNALLEVSGW